MTRDEFQAALFDLLHQADAVPKADLIKALELACEVTSNEVPDDDE